MQRVSRLYWSAFRCGPCLELCWCSDITVISHAGSFTANGGLATEPLLGDNRNAIEGVMDSRWLSQINHSQDISFLAISVVDVIAAMPRVDYLSAMLSHFLRLDLKCSTKLLLWNYYYVSRAMSIENNNIFDNI